MAQLIDIVRVVVGSEYLTATVRFSNNAPLMTSEDLEGTTRVYYLLPTIIDHACAGDAGNVFMDCMGDTELAHLLEHVTVELLARTNLVQEIVAGRTWRELETDGCFSIRLDCVDDVLVAGALSSAVWIMEWAFSGGEGAVPDVDAIVDGLVQLVSSLPGSGAQRPLADVTVYERDDDGYEAGFEDDGAPYAGNAGYEDDGYGDDAYADDGYAGDGYADDGYGDAGYGADGYADDGYADGGYADDGYDDGAYGNNAYDDGYDGDGYGDAPYEDDEDAYGNEEAYADDAPYEDDAAYGGYDGRRRGYEPAPFDGTYDFFGAYPRDDGGAYDQGYADDGYWDYAEPDPRRSQKIL